jgi:hypothetical protein
MLPSLEEINFLGIASGEIEETPNQQAQITR